LDGISEEKNEEDLGHIIFYQTDTHRELESCKMQVGRKCWVNYFSFGYIKHQRRPLVE